MARFALLSALIGVLGCDACAPKEKLPPIHYVEKGAEGVVELANLGVLSHVRKQVSERFQSVIPDRQMKEIQQELTVTLGFDPTTEAGLGQAGLPKKGRAAVQLLENGILVILPVVDEKKLRTTFKKLVSGRRKLDEVKKEKSASGNAYTIYATSFGPKKVPVAALAFHQGSALIATGRDAAAVVKKALDLKPADRIATHPEYIALDKSLPLTPQTDVRLIAPRPGRVMSMALETSLSAAALAGLGRKPDLSLVKSIGWTARASGKTTDLEGRLRLQPKGIDQLSQLFTKREATPKGVRAVQLKDAVVVAQAAGDPVALLNLLAPKGSRSRSRLDGVLSKAKSDIKTDFEQEVLPLLSGHVALGLGLGDLSAAPFAQITSNPAQFVWTAFAIGTKDAKKAAEIEERFDEGLTKRGFEVAKRKVKETNVKVVKLPSKKEGAPGTILIETAGFEGGLLFANEPRIMDLVIGEAPPNDPLAGQPGIAISIRVAQLTRVLSTFNLRSLPIIYRAIVSKGLQLLLTLDSIDAHVSPVQDGLAIKGKITLAK